MENLVRFGALELRISPVALLYGSLHLADMELSGLEFNTPRKTSGALPEPPPSGTADDTASGWGLPGLDLDVDMNDLFDGILKKLEPPEIGDLETVRLAESIQQESMQRYEALKGLFDKLRNGHGRRHCYANRSGVFPLPLADGVCSEYCATANNYTLTWRSPLGLQSRSAGFRVVFALRYHRVLFGARPCP